MMEDLDSIKHKPFKYIYVPADVAAPIEERSFDGTEGAFKEEMKSHFAAKPMHDKESLVDHLGKGLAKGSEALSETQKMHLNAATAATTYQIIPLCLPSKKNGFIAVNAYIDDVGMYKDYDRNPRAERLTSNEIIKGDCFVSKTFDNDDDFNRVDFTTRDFHEMMQNPPSASNRWDQGKALQQMLQQQQGGAPATADPIVRKCGGCGKVAEDDSVKLLRCSRCKAAAYCNATCQREDWQFHKRVCKDPAAAAAKPAR
eukprot:GDKH01025406.1.p1 GENE.GDKH01025406.1~~GDKH01025406.1.p1  ORF type:complete len:257 (-),score=51.52 GDKH01025406.1:101-871(-)